VGLILRGPSSSHLTDNGSAEKSFRLVLRDPSGPAPSGRKGPRLREVLSIIRGRFGYFLAFFCVVIGSVAVFTFSQTPVYQASSLVLIEPGTVNISKVETAYDPTRDSSDREYYRTQHELLRSRHIAEPVFRSLGLDRDPRFAHLPDPCAAFLEHVSVAPVRESRLVNVGFESSDPAEAARVSDAIVDAYIADTSQRALGVSSDGLAQLRERAEKLHGDVETAATAIERLKEKHNYVALGEEHTTLLASLGTLNEELAKAQATRFRSEAELAVIESGGAAGAAAGADAERIAEARLAVEKLEEEREGALAVVKEKHQAVTALKARLAVARARLLEATQFAVAVARVRLEASREVETSLRAEIDRQTKTLFEWNRSAGALRVLVQQHEALEETYKSVLGRIEEIELAAATGLKDTNVFVVQRAFIPSTPVAPRATLNLGLAAIVGLAGGLGLCFLVHAMDRTIKSKEDVERHLGHAVVGHVPQVHGEAGVPPEVAAAKSPRSQVGEAFRSLRTALAVRVGSPAPGEGPRRLVVTSTLPGDGKTLVATNLAIALAQGGNRVLLVDADLRRPRLLTLFGIKKSAGFSSLLARDGGVMRVDEAVCSGGIPGLHVLPSGPIPPSPADLFRPEALGDLLHAWEERYDWVIFDAPPANVADPAILASHVGHALLIVRSFATPADLARRACDRLAAVGANVVGVVLDDADGRQQAHGGMAYDYGYGYGDASAFEAPVTSKPAPIINEGNGNGHGDGEATEAAAPAAVTAVKPKARQVGLTG
jgi:capsular exopolysaccharide synthesis family protein